MAAFEYRQAEELHAAPIPFEATTMVAVPTHCHAALRRGPQDPERLYSPELIVGQLAGWRIERAERARRPVETDAGTRDAIDTVVRAVKVST